MKINSPWKEIVSIDDKFGRHIAIDDTEQRELLAWFRDNKFDFVREVMNEVKVTEDNWDPAVHGYCCDNKKRQPSTPEWLSQALNEGGGVYRP